MTDILALIGNPRPRSRTHSLARALATELAAVTAEGAVVEVDLASLGPHVLDPLNEAAAEAVHRVLAADILVVASPTFKATYSGLLKAFLDRLGTGALSGTPAIPILLGGSADHRLAVDVHFTPLLFELGATVPARGLYVLESEVKNFPARAAEWVAEHAESFVPRGENSRP